MADTNVTELRPSPAKGERTAPKDPTGALRARRLRARRKAATVTPAVTANVTTRVAAANTRHLEKINDIKRDVTVFEKPVKGRNGVTLATMAAALSLATVSAGFSVTGLTAIFVGAFWPVVAMGVALELGKLSAVAWLSRYGAGAGVRLKGCLVALVAMLMGLNAVGAYGFLAKAHIGHEVEGDVAVASRGVEVESRIAVQAQVVSDLDRRLGQIDSAVTEATRRGRTSAAMQLATDQRRARGELAADRVREGRALASLQVEKSKIEGERKTIEADLGPVRYLAVLLGTSDQDVLRCFILAVALLLDPAAVLLLLAASARR